MENVNVPLITAVVSMIGFFIWSRREQETRFYKYVDSQSAENAALKQAVKENSDKVAGLEKDLSAEREKTREERLAKEAAQEERDTLKVTNAQLDAKYKDEQTKLANRVADLEKGRKEDAEAAEKSRDALAAEHRKELAKRDEREAGLVAERDAERKGKEDANKERDIALAKVDQLQQDMKELRKEVEDLTTELRRVKEQATRPQERDPNDGGSANGHAATGPNEGKEATE